MAKNIYIFYPDEKIGGGPFWLMRLANELSKDKSYKVHYIDYKNGYSHIIPEARQEKDVIFVDYEDNDLKLFLPEEGIIFAPIYMFDKFLHANLRSTILFHNWHNECLPVLKRVLDFTEDELVLFMSKVFAHNAQVFVDGSHQFANNKILGIPFPHKYIPMVLPHRTYRCMSSFVDEREINIAILGCLVLDKIYAVNNVILQAEKYKTSKRINIHIIGDGTARDLILKSSHSNINVIFCGILTNDELYQYLGTKVDILFAMGTSVLEGATIGLPSFIIPSAMQSFDCDKFVYLSETKNYLTGFYPEHIDELKLPTHSFASICDSIYNNQKQKIGTECLRYVENNHSISNVVLMFKEALENTSLTLEDILPYYERIFGRARRNTSSSKPLKLNFKNKVRYKIWKHYDKKLRKKGIIK